MERSAEKVSLTRWLKKAYPMGGPVHSGAAQVFPFREGRGGGGENDGTADSPQRLK